MKLQDIPSGQSIAFNEQLGSNAHPITRQCKKSISNTTGALHMATLKIDCCSASHLPRALTKHGYGKYCSCFCFTYCGLVCQCVRVCVSRACVSLFLSLSLSLSHLLPLSYSWATHEIWGGTRSAPSQTTSKGRHRSVTDVVWETYPRWGGGGWRVRETYLGRTIKVCFRLPYAFHHLWPLSGKALHNLRSAS